MESLGSSWRLCLQLQNNAFVDDLLKAVASSPMSKSTLISINCGLDLHFRFFLPEIHLSTCHHLHSFKLYHPLYAIRHDYDPHHCPFATSDQARGNALFGAWAGAGGLWVPWHGNLDVLVLMFSSFPGLLYCSCAGTVFTQASNPCKLLLIN